MDKKMLILFGTLLAIVLGIIGSIIAWVAGGQELQGNEREAIRQMFNYEITFLILSVLLGWIPLIGQLLFLGLWVANIVFAIQAYNAASKNTEVNIPSFNFVK